MYCNNCGNELAEGAKFCSACGTNCAIKERTPTKLVASIKKHTKVWIIGVIACVLLSIILIVCLTPTTPGINSSAEAVSKAYIEAMTQTDSYKLAQCLPDCGIRSGAAIYDMDAGVTREEWAAGRDEFIKKYNKYYGYDFGECKIVSCTSTTEDFCVFDPQNWTVRDVYYGYQMTVEEHDSIEEIAEVTVVCDTMYEGRVRFTILCIEMNGNWYALDSDIDYLD